MSHARSSTLPELAVASVSSSPPGFESKAWNGHLSSSRSDGVSSTRTGRLTRPMCVCARSDCDDVERINLVSNGPPKPSTCCLIDRSRRRCPKTFGRHAPQIMRRSPPQERSYPQEDTIQEMYNRRWLDGRSPLSAACFYIKKKLKKKRLIGS